MNEIITEEKIYRQISKRLRKFRNILEPSKKNLANQLGLSGKEIQNLETSKIEEDQLFYILDSLRKTYGVNVNWLIYGKGFVFIEKGPKITEKIYENNKLLFLNLPMGSMGLKMNRSWIL